MGLPTTIHIGEELLGEGHYGTVNRASLAVYNGQTTQVFQCAIKISKNGPLDDVVAHRLFPEALACDGIISYIPLDDKSILMPLATGSLDNKIGKVSLQKACQIALLIAEQMMCMLMHGVIYYDLVPRNVLYFCNHDGITISLADIGSTIPHDRHASGLVHLSALPIPQRKEYHVVSTNYTLLLINFITIMVTGKGINLDQIGHFQDSVKEWDNGGPLSALLIKSVLERPFVEDFMVDLNKVITDPQ